MEPRPPARQPTSVRRSATRALLIAAVAAAICAPAGGQPGGPAASGPGSADAPPAQAATSPPPRPASDLPADVLQVLLCAWHSGDGATATEQDAQRGLAELALYFVNRSDQHWGPVELRFTLHPADPADPVRELELELDEFVVAHGAMYTHVLLEADPARYPRVTGAVTHAERIRIPGERRNR